ncbi:hypothetical protein P3T76_012966 [Phytophthora citrophthora]|uniref:Uncharacterized protein n=1 Tax=Phytophthora citrophthora TaxID=4793 RepID=A0AAD9G435_9STRA|nr:hypothetical protein P3T76_012966 [Phytophthora citrophthora]
MEAARSLLRSSPAPSPVRNVLASGTAMWASPSVARSRRPSNLVGTVRASPSFPLSRDTAVRTTVERNRRTVPVQSWMTQSTQTDIPVQSNTGVHLGDFGEVGTMTAETVDFLIRVLEDRKQELLVGEDADIRVKARCINEVGGITREVKHELSNSASRVARIQLDSTNGGGAGVTELVRSHSYEALVQLEGILEARHNKLMSDGVLEATDGDS